MIRTRSTLPTFVVLLALAAPLPARAERLMDSMDALTSAWSATQTQWTRGDFQDLLPSAQKAVQLAQDRFGPLHPSVVPYFNNLAVVEQTLALYPEAEAHFRWGLALGERAMGPSDPSLADSLVPLARLLDQLGRFEEASLTLQRALAIQRASGEKSSSAQAQSLDLAADIEEHQGRLDQAVLDLKQALGLPGLTDPALEAVLLTRLGKLEISLKNFQEAEPLLQKALALNQKNGAPGSIAIADSLRALADLKEASGDEVKARALAAQSLDLDLHFIGPEDTYANIPYHQRGAEAYFFLGRWKDAQGLYQRVLAIKKQVYGPLHPEVALSLENLAEVSVKLGEKDQARKDLGQALAIFQKYFAPDHPLILDAKKKLSFLNRP